MEGAFGWIGRLFQFFASLIPTWIILNNTEGAVKFVTLRVGDLVRFSLVPTRFTYVKYPKLTFRWDTHSEPIELKPGLHFYWPAVTEIKMWVCARQSLNMDTQTLTTTDGKTIAVGGLLIYHISDILTIIANTWNPDATISDIAAGVVHDICSQNTWQELQDRKNSRDLYVELRREMRKRLRPFGVKVIDATLTDFSPCRVIKLINSSSSD